MQEQKKNVALELDRLITSLPATDYLGSDGMCNGQDAFQWDFTYDGKRMRIFLITPVAEAS